MDIFEIVDITKHYDDGDLASGKVRFHHQEPYSDGEVAQVVEVDIRISIGDDATLAQVHDALLAKAVSQLRHALERCEGRSATELLQQSAADYNARIEDED